MKRFFALLLALILLCPFSLAETTVTQEYSTGTMTIWRNHLEQETDLQKITLDYPTFECGNAAFQQFLTETVTDPIFAMGAVEEGTVRGGYYASLDFEGILSVEASAHRMAPESNEAEVELFYAIVDLNGRRSLTVEELFEEPAAVVDEVICNAAYEKALGYGILLDSITDSGLMPLPDSYYLTADALRVLYDTNTVSQEAVALDLPWEELPIAFSPVLGAPETAQPEYTLEPAEMIIGGADGPTAIFVAQPQATLDPEAWTTVSPVPASPTPMPTVTPFPVETLNPNFSLAPVVTPTPMPVAGNDAIMVDVLTHGLWKPLGTEGDVYYQFTEDGKLLTVSVSEYKVTDGVLESEVLSGTLDIGSDSAFTLRSGSDLSGYVLNRQGERVAPEEFVTPSPTPVPTPTPTPTPVPTPTPTPSPVPTPTPSPTPEPTPVPTPTLSPYEQAKAIAPRLAVLTDVGFEKARTFKVYTAPGETTWSAEGAQVTTDETVAIYGVDNSWVMVSYAIGDGSRGRMGYVENTTLANPQGVPDLGLCAVKVPLIKGASATDDPLRSQNAVTRLKAGTEVTLLGFLGDDWAYIQTTFESKVTRLFIPVDALEE